MNMQIKGLSFSTLFILVLFALAAFPLSAQEGPGDTPIVIVGGSVKLNQGASNDWTPVTAGASSTTAAGPITAIVVKDASDGDKLTIAVDPSSTWEIDINSDLTPGTPAVIITPGTVKTNLNVKAADSKGQLVKVGAKDLRFRRKSACPSGNCDAVGLTSITVIVDSVSLGTFNCNQSGPKQCKIVLRE
jgi:hypothetical protein